MQVVHQGGCVIQNSNTESISKYEEQVEKECNFIFDDEDEMEKSLSRIYRGDLYLAGRIWIAILRTVLVGVKLCLIPTVKAAPPPHPVKPPLMKYTDLPIYDTPHKDFKEYCIDRKKCQNANTKIMHTMVLPHVREFRKCAQKSLCAAKCELKDTYDEVSDDFANAVCRFKAYMRDKANLPLRQGVMAGGAAAGLYLGSGGGIPRKLFGTAMGAAAAGSLCFPKETDEIFREFMFHTSNAFVAIYNKTCGKNFVINNKIPCPKDVPGIPKKGAVEKCKK